MQEKVKDLLNELYAMESSQTYQMSNPEAAVIKLLPYRNRKTEHFITMLVDNKNNFMGKKLISKGTVDQSPVFPREIFRYAIMKCASGVILGHNHPGGDPTPSSQDIELTERIKQGAKIVGVRLLDHLIVARDGHYSFNEHGLI